jgi:CBS domain-containing protein
LTKTARDVMTTKVISITGDETLQEAIDLMDRHNISGLPVTDAQNMLIGIISNTDIIHYSQKVNVVPLFDPSGWISPHTDINDLASIRRGIDLLARTKVSKLMKKKVYTASEKTPLIEIARLMSRRQINRVPIVNREGKLTGIITRADMVRSIADRDDPI